MFKLKGKTIWLFALITLGIAGVGLYFYISLTSLNKLVVESAYPQKRSNYLKDITIDINKLNNLYLLDSIKFSFKKADTILARIEQNIDSIKTELQNSKTIEVSKLDTIPKLLRSVQVEYLELQRIKEKNQSKFLNDLESLLKKELADLEINRKDSVTIIKQVTSEIYKHSIDENKNFNEIDEEEEESKNFFQRLFGSSNKKNAEAKKDNNDSKVKEQIEANNDTVVSTSIDTLQTITQINNLPEKRIISIFESVQQKRQHIIDVLNKRENEIFQKNTEVNKYIEKILNDILLEEFNTFNANVNNFSKKSESYLWKSSLIIFIILLLGVFSIYVIITDINKSIYYQDRLKENEKKAIKETEENQKFLSTMSHELRTPLTSIIGYTELLNEDDDNVKAIKTASNYLYQMTNEILDISKIKAGIIEIKKEVFNLNEVFEMIKHNFEPLIKNQNIEVFFEIPEEKVYVNSDRYRIQQIIYNLVHNALKYTDKGFIKIGFIKNEINHQKSEINIFIEDTGVGMTSDEQKTIFKDYHQAGTHKSKMKGTGLGIGIVKNLVNKLGGQIKLTSEVNKGSKFEVLLKLENAQPSDVREEEKTLQLPDNILDGKTIFAVDDDKLITSLFKTIFTNYGAKVTVMNSSLQALNHLKENRYDLAIFDMKMPEMSGVDLIDELAKNNLKLSKTVICTANVLLSDEQKNILKKFDFQLYKPFNKQDIIKLIIKAFNFDIQDYYVFDEEKIKSTPETKKDLDFSYSLKDLVPYTGDDKDALMEMLRFLLAENVSELEIFEEMIEKENLEEVANQIHKLSSRFAQLNIKPPYDPKTLELRLRNGETFILNQAVEIFNFWKHCNQSLIDKYNIKI
ncbi:ATP-binding response regulator [Psychroflexus sp. MBR-150]|jgi:signal transduction histidine kinase/CheY-like chemotaxis protein